MFTKNRETTNEKKPSYSDIILFNLTATTLTNLGVHPLRVALNWAATTASPKETLQVARKYLFKDAHINIARGSVSTGFQSIVKHAIQAYLGTGTTLSSTMTAFGVCLAGLPATLIEVCFMRSNALRSAPTKAALTQAEQRLFKYNPAIFTFFLTREFSFGGSVFCTEHMGTYQRGLVFLAGSCASGMAHKLLAMEVTKEILKITSDVPNYNRDNIANVAQKIAYGKYRHHSLHVPIKDPKNLLHLGINFFSATCGWNMGLFRLTYLIAFSNLLSFVKIKLEKNASEPYSSARFFDLAMPVAGLSDESNRDITHSNKPH